MHGPHHGRACRVAARSSPTVGRAVSLCGPTHGGACCADVWPASWSAVLRCCVAPLMVGRAVLVRGPPHCAARFVAPCPPGWLCVVWWCLAWVVVVFAAWRQVSSGSGWWCLWCGLFCLFDVVFAALPSACSAGCGWRLGCVDRLAEGCSLLVRGPPHGGACSVGACPPPWWGVLRWFVAPLMVGRALLVRGPCMVERAVLVPVGRGRGAWCGGVWLGLSSSVGLWLRLYCLPRPGWCSAVACPPPPCWGMLCLFVAPLMVGCAVLVCGPPHDGACCVDRGPPHGGAYCVGAWPPSWCGVLCWCLPVAVVVRGLVWWCLAWVVVVCWMGCGCGCVACLAGVVAVLVRPPPPVGACRVCAWPPPWWGVLYPRVRASVRGVVAGSMLGLFCWFAVVSAAVRPALSDVGCLWCLPGQSWCCAGACPPPPCWGVLCLCVAPPVRNILHLLIHGMLSVSRLKAASILHKVSH